MSLSNITPDVARRLRLDDNTKGAVVVDVDPASPAARAGIMPGDVITRVGRAPVSSVADASRELAASRRAPPRFSESCATARTPQWW